MKAIVYTSNTGTTKEYAELLSDKLSLPYYSLDEIKYKVKPGSKIIYLGWIMASGVKGYKKVVKDYDVRAVCAVGMGATGTQVKEVRTKIKSQVQYQSLLYKVVLMLKNFMEFIKL